MKDNGFDFKECDFISTEMKFYTYKDFCRNCNAIKRLYDKQLTKYGKIFYKWYVYANVHITIGQKNKIWDFINNYADLEELISLLK